ncbi:DUF1853 family protein [Halopseudomonas pelagia]|uniref:DUF1853 family protein n=1 Tax=Halopseudomonas pelagia TaxID=553151 RepID=UPI0030D8D2EA|tara:strand:+ start:226 stop:1173 length:948 start_codon:yes stop_codon:yes gene_type:complete
MTFSSESPSLQSPGLESPDLTRFRNPAVRHLAWMCHTTQLLGGPQVMAMRAYWPDDLLARLTRWDAEPEAGPAVLTEAANPRLGMYFESLYACLLTDVLGWDLLVRNLPIRRGGITLGELDFVVRNPHSGLVEHHEIAVKFYLGYIQPGSVDSEQNVSWYGPNARDRLDLKTRRLLDEQSQRTALPEAVAALRQRGIEQPQISRIFMPGYLFYPRNTQVQAAEWVPADHPRGGWAYLKAALQLDMSDWVPLRKPHWLGPWVQPSAPSADEREIALAEIRDAETPRLFAQLRQHPLTDDWCEVQRIFVMPARWPGV